MRLAISDIYTKNIFLNNDQPVWLHILSAPTPFYYFVVVAVYAFEISRFTNAAAHIKILYMGKINCRTRECHNQITKP